MTEVPVKKHGRETVRDMLLSLAVVMAVVIVIYVFTRPTGDDAVKVVDPGPTVTSAETAADYDLVAPKDLADSWRTTSATFDTEGEVEGATETELRLGYVTPSDEFALYVQSDAAYEDVLKEELRNPEQTGTERIAGEEWARYRTRGDETALVHRHPESTLVVTGNASLEELTALAASLR